MSRTPVGKLERAALAQLVQLFPMKIINLFGCLLIAFNVTAAGSLESRPARRAPGLPSL